MGVEKQNEARGGQIFIGAGILFCIGFFVVGLLLCWRLIPGVVGESFGILAGILSTPFFMEASFLVIGLLIVLGLNIWRRRRAGDDFVVMDVEKSGSDGPRKDRD